MQRRDFLKLSGTGAAVAVLTPTALMTAGCSFNIAAGINTVLDSALAILKVAEPGSPWITQLASGIAALEQAETAWKAGGAATLVIDALNTIEAVLAVIPITAAYSPLISILVAGIEAVMAAFNLTAQLSANSMAKRKTIVQSPYYGRVHLNGPNLRHPTWTGAYKAQWNSAAVALGLAAAEIK